MDRPSTTSPVTRGAWLRPSDSEIPDEEGSSELETDRVEDRVDAHAEEDDSSDDQREGRRDAPVQLGDLLATRRSKEKGVGDGGEEDAGDHVEDVVLLREESRQPYEESTGRRDDAEAAVHPVAAQRRDERMRDVKRGETVVRGIGRIEEPQPPRREPVSRHGVVRPRRDGRIEVEEEVRGDPDRQVGEHGPPDQLLPAHDEDRQQDQKKVERSVDEYPGGLERDPVVEG